MTRSELLAEYGIIDRPEITVTPIQEAGVLWWVGISGVGDPIKGVSTKNAAELAGRLHSIGEGELAHRISVAAKETQRYNAAVR